MPDSGTAAPTGDDPTESGPTTVTTGNVPGAAGAVPGLRPGEGDTGEGLPRARGGHRGGVTPGKILGIPPRERHAAGYDEPVVHVVDRGRPPGGVEYRVVLGPGAHVAGQ